MKYILLMFAILFSSASYAEDEFFSVDLFSEWKYTVAYNVFTYHHFRRTYENGFENNKEYDYNENNGFVGIRVNINDKLGLSYAEGTNSVDSPSKIYSFEHKIDTIINENFDYGYDAGFITGYEKVNSSGINIFVAPFIRYSYYFDKDFSVAFKVNTMNLAVETGFLEISKRF